MYGYGNVVRYFESFLQHTYFNLCVLIADDIIHVPLITYNVHTLLYGSEEAAKKFLISTNSRNVY